MADSTVRVNEPAAGGKLVDNESLTVGANAVQRQRIQVAGAAATEIARVTDVSPPPGSMALAVREVEDLYRRTPFGETRIAQPYTLGDFVQRYGFDAALMSKAETNGGTVTDVLAQSATVLAVTANGDRAQQASRESFRYQPGHATRWRSTVVLAAATTNTVYRWGQFDAGNGLFFQRAGTTASVVVRSSTSGSPVDTVVPQASWNVDPMDGTGASGKTLDLTKLNIFECTYQWLGAGVAWWFINGILVHVSDHPGELSVPYMSTAVLPLQWDLVSTGDAGSMTLVCSNVVSEGGASPPTLGFGAAREAAKSVPDVPPGESVIAIRPKATFNGIENRIQVVPTLASVSGAGSGSDSIMRVVLNPTLTGASWVNVDATSGVEYDVSATTYTGGIVLASFFLDNEAQRELDLRAIFDRVGRKLLVDPLTGDRDVLAIVGQDAAAGTTDVFGGLTWLEVR